MLHLFNAANATETRLSSVDTDCKRVLIINVRESHTASQTYRNLHAPARAPDVSCTGFVFSFWKSWE